MRSYKVSSSLRPYVRRRLRRSLYSCNMLQDTDGTWQCQTSASADTFHSIVEMAKADKLSDETGICTAPQDKVNRYCYLEGCTAFAVPSLKECYL